MHVSLGSSTASTLIRFSDLTGKHVENDGDLVRVVVRQHPDLEGGPVEIEALAEELATVEELALDLVTIELHFPDADEPETVVLEAEAFNRLASAAPMADVLRGAKRVTRTVPSQAAMPAGARERVTTPAWSTPAGRTRAAPPTPRSSSSSSTWTRSTRGWPPRAPGRST
ncbi:hypothetical protein ACIF6L_38240 [Kitasatospora sp. NPDC086009]|uniref:hypothetical protein n=1 Tax=unclassified Kitasatospora TaxID=2633591 RepID=UPI0037CAED32